MSRITLSARIVLLCAPALATSAFADPSKTILGYLGQANRRISIYAAPNSHARVYSRAKPSQYLVILPYSEKWDKILLQKGIYGFANATAIKNLPYTLSPKPRDSYRVGGSALPLGDLASRSGMAQYAMHFIGTPYKWGGNDPINGIDCSGFVKDMYGRIGVNLPRTAAEQALVGQPIYRLEDLRPGDRLYFWEAARGKIGHTGIYEGRGYFIHSSHGRGGVTTSFLSPSWRKILVAARR
ncbi:MAG TPA: C40 family peptidase [Fimbriimonas sp.]|nr:C40 family peptidase [Fimbriimonas sp.]